ncbi:MAG: formylglycine-generating enzyme family protein, partial [Chloroflexi bacterium]|nr:formylglycine-generating enzyme family protein [Chloroflexota bacterium]
TRPRYWNDARFATPNKPVVGISWYEALAYCNWLSAKTGRPYRLPTEAEWERTARHTDGREYPWGNEWQDGIVNSEEAEVGKTTAVGSFPDSTAACGAQDMSGNVWEWCQTRYVSQEPYRGDDGREDLSGGGGRVLRGGSWYEDKGPSRCAARNRLDPWGRGIILGFRCCATSSLPPGSES